MSRFGIIALAFGLSLPAGPLVGQGFHREGFWFGGGLGGGWTAGEDSGNEAGPALYFRAGGTLSRDFLMGGDLLGWYWKSGDEELLRSSLSITALFYPLPRGNFFLRGSAGFAHAETSRPSSIPGILEREFQDGFSMGLGVGYDIRLSASISLTPNVDVVGYNFSGFNTGLSLFTLGITWH